MSNCLFVDDLTLITENAHDLQCAINNPCEAYGNCRLKHQPLFHGTEHNLKTFLSNDNQTGIAGLLWDIRKIMMNLDMEC